MKTWRNIQGRCTIPTTHKFKYYGGKGIKNLLTPSDLQFIWERDGAANMLQPSIDRKRSEDDYSLETCRFIEFVDNIKNNGRSKRKARSAAMPTELKQTNCRLSEATHRGLRMALLVRGITMDAAMNEAVEKWLEEQGKQD